MKKVILGFSIIIIIMVTLYVSNNQSYFPLMNKFSLENLDSKTTEGTKEELYQDVFLTLLDPYIQKAINDFYYNKILKEAPTEHPVFTKVLSVTRPSGYRTFEFLIKLEVSPYVGPHLSVGLDQMTFRIQADGSVKLENYEHQETYELPPHWQGIQIK